jgi:outer membrane biogenesis lipoprotein LolB
MKRTLAAVLLAAAPLLLTACGDDEPDPTGDSVTENTQDEPEPVATE